ncbi:UDP-2,4-diacetamido-2,4,6-trideoxy-beta-L-altropyranose hydrolase [Idiomarina sp.]|uniref:UDP-2,4-diacetamido-2,4, 6-trideoxy-beta-L-altropyranose hydrolase n=1 Tax=Idiomarina sp. TaxID=1874361 RepID=UPI003A8DAB1B
MLVKTIVFRVDASIEMGAGHVMRCLTLADELSQNGHKCTFISRRQPGSLINLVKERGYSVHELPECEESEGNHLTHGHWLKGGQEKDVQESLNVLEKLAPDPDWLVIDHYGIDKFWEQRARNQVKNILVIDDLADREHDCDFLIDQNLGQTDDIYYALVPEECQILTGCHYALLRPEFADCRELSLEYRKGKTQIDRVLISMGGVDKDNYTEKVLTALASSGLSDRTEVTVVLGKQAPWLTEVKAQAINSRLNVRVLSNVSNMAELMSQSDLAIGAAGSTSWERCCLGLPTLMCVLAENQQGIAEALETHEAAMVLSQSDISTSLGEKVAILYEQPERLSLMSDCASHLVDGRGAQRVAQSIFKGVE